LFCCKFILHCVSLHSLRLFLSVNYNLGFRYTFYKKSPVKIKSKDFILDAL